MSDETFVEVVVLVGVNSDGDYAVSTETGEAPDVLLSEDGYDTTNVRTVRIKVKVPLPIAPDEIAIEAPAEQEPAPEAELA